MIGSHDSFSYLDATSSVMNVASRYWRTQDKSITEQYKSGVRFFDVRVKREVDGSNRTHWRVCHGPAEFTKLFTTLKAICVYFTTALKGCKYRIWLEKGTDEDWECFKKEITPLVEKYEGLVQSYRKSNYELLFQKDTYPQIEYYACKMEDKKNWVKGLYEHPIKEWAKTHNPVITQDMIDDEGVVYFMDYI